MRVTSRIEAVTVMFTDVAGSTALRERIGEDGAERLRLADDAIVGGADEEHDGPKPVSLSPKPSVRRQKTHEGL